MNSSLRILSRLSSSLPRRFVATKADHAASLGVTPQVLRPASQVPDSAPSRPINQTPSTPESIAEVEAALAAAYKEETKIRAKNIILALSIASFVVGTYLYSIRTVREGVDTLRGGDMKKIHEELDRDELIGGNSSKGTGKSK